MFILKIIEYGKLAVLVLVKTHQVAVLEHRPVLVQTRVCVFFYYFAFCLRQKVQSFEFKTLNETSSFLTRASLDLFYLRGIHVRTFMRVYV